MKIDLPYHLERKARVFVILGGVFMFLSFALAALLWTQERYDLLLYIDVPLHLFGGGTSALVFLITIVMLHGEVHFESLRYWLRVILVLGFTSLVTLAWEVFEYFTDTYLGTSLQSTVIETLRDMMVGLVGAMPVAFWLTVSPLGRHHSEVSARSAKQSR